MDPYLSLTAHYIDSLPGDPYHWELKAKLLGYTYVKGNHSGANTAAVVLRIIDSYNIRSKVRTPCSRVANQNG